MARGNLELIDSVGPSMLKNMIRESIRIRQPLMIWGQPGIGKSDTVAQVAQELNRPLIDIRLPLLEPTDMRGIPYLAEIKVYDATGKLLCTDDGLPITEKEFRWSPPSDLPRDATSNALVFYDEISAATPSVQAATYQIILNRRIGNYKLPDDVAIIAAGNRVKDRGVAYNMPSALRNRFMHSTLDVHVEDWKEWAIMNRIHKHVVGYISFAAGDLNTFGTHGDSEAFATPRSWCMVSKLLQHVNEQGELVDSNINEETLRNLIKGSVGIGPGTKFMSYRKRADVLPPVRSVLDGTVKKLPDCDIDITYALTTGMVYEIVDIHEHAQRELIQGKRDGMDKFYSYTDNMLRFMMENFQDEMTVMGAKSILGKPHRLDMNAQKLKNWSEFTRKYHDLLTF